jgi:hypothetical protein
MRPASMWTTFNTLSPALAWFPETLGLQDLCYLTTAHPSGRIWAGAFRNQVYLVKLEGGPSTLK